MAYDEELASKIQDRTKGWNSLESKKMFGGIGLLINGNMCVGTWKEFLILRVGETEATKLLQEKETKVFDITGKVMKGWVMVSPEGRRNDQNLKRYLVAAKKFVDCMPAK